MSVHRQISLFKFVLCFCITILIIDAFESWLKYKHRTTCLKRLANYESKQLTMAAGKFNQWLKNKWNDLLYLRETNHTKVSTHLWLEVLKFWVLVTCTWLTKKKSSCCYNYIMIYILYIKMFCIVKFIVV